MSKANSRSLLKEQISNGSIPPYVYTYPTRSSYRKIAESLTIREIWRQDETNSPSLDLNLYIHFPFCRTKCSFCNLYSIALTDEKILNAYTEAICYQIHSFAEIIQKRNLRTIYFGGGTPSMFSISDFEKIFSAFDHIYPNWRMVIEEVSMEATPQSICKSPELVKKLIEMGLTRINLGIQSLVKTELDFIERNRDSDIETIYKAIEILRQLKIANLSTDLIIGIDKQSDITWTESVKELVKFKPDTISTYFLTVRPDARLARKTNYDYARNPLLYKRYDSAREIILANGYVHDTNIRYKLLGTGGYKQKSLQFNGVPYLGLGCGARTYTNTVDYCFGQKPSKTAIDKFLIKPYNPDTVVEEGFIYDDEERIRKRLVLNLFDINLEDLQKYNLGKYSNAINDILDACVQEGLLITLGKNRYQLSPEGLKYRDIISWMLFSDKVVRLDKEFYDQLHVENLQQKSAANN